MSALRIARFVDVQACKQVFSDYSTFVLRSAEHYRMKCETDGGDEKEMIQRTLSNGSAEVSRVLISCWTILDKPEPAVEEWAVFRGMPVAIISDPARVCSVLERAFDFGDYRLPSGRRSPLMSVTHKAVRYADEVPDVNKGTIWESAVFTKRLKFHKQNEYRFAIPYAASHWIDSYIFATSDPGAYMEKCLVNPEMLPDEKATLLRVLLDAMAGYGSFGRMKMSDIVANSDVLFPQRVKK